MRLAVEDTLALVIDIQERLMPVIYQKDETIECTEKLIKGLNILNIPIIVTQQYTKGLGMTIPSIQKLLPIPFIYQEKISFSCMGEPTVFELIKEYNKSNIIVCGVEAHICVLQSIIDLVDSGYQVFVVEDCISSRKENDKEVALKRMIKEGAYLTTCESVLFELTVEAGTEHFKEISRLIK